MSITFNLRGNSHVLGADYYPTIELDDRYEYALGLIGLHTYNTIPNIFVGNNKFYYTEGSESEDVDKNKVIIIPDGSYEISDLEEFIRRKLKASIHGNDDDDEKRKATTN